MRDYEMMIIIDPELGDERISQKIEEVKELIEKGGGKVEKTDDWGIKKFAYPIKKREEGYYYIYYFKSPPEYTLELRKKIEFDREILRSMILRRGD